MLNNPRRHALLLIAAALALTGGSAHAEGWFHRLFDGRPGGFRTAQELEKATTVAVGGFTGGTGETAEQALRSQLSINDSVQMIDKGARFTITGASVGGRITSRLADHKGKVIFERTYAAPGLDDNVKALADDIIFAVTGHPGLNTSKIAFVSDVTGSKQIYICDTNGANVEQVTRQAYGAVSPAIASDGSMLAYTGYGSGFANVMLIDMGAGQERQMANTPGMNTSPSFSPDARKLALTMSFVGNPEIFILDLANGHAICVTESVGAPSSPTWHPDGRRLMYSANEGGGPQLFVVDTSTEQSSARWPTDYAFAADPEWSPNGSQVAFTTRIGNDWAVAVQAYPSGSSKVIQRSGAQHPTWSPDGRSLAYTQHGQLWVHDLKNGRRHSIVSGRGDISEPRWMR